MCCFSGRVKVEHTNIFARSAPKGRQYIVYQMSVLANNDVAMILPLPVPPKAADDAVRFINLEKYPKFFDDLERAFYEPTQPYAAEEEDLAATPSRCPSSR